MQENGKPQKLCILFSRTLTLFRVKIKKFSLYRIKITLLKLFEILLISNLILCNKGMESLSKLNFLIHIFLQPDGVHL